MSALIPIGPLKPQHAPEVYQTLMSRCYDLADRIELATVLGIINPTLEARFIEEFDELERLARRLKGENT